MTSINEMSDGPPEDELFPLGTLPGDGVMLKTLIKPSHRVELTVSMMSAEIDAPKDQGLLDPDKEGLLLVTYEIANYHPTPIREGQPGDKRLVGWKIRQAIRPIYHEPVRGEAGTVEAGFAALCTADPSAAAALHARMGKRLEKELQKA